MRRGSLLAVVAAIAWIAAATLPVHAAPPEEVTDLLIDSGSTLSWNATPGADKYHIYRGLGDELLRGIPPRCHATRITDTTFESLASPPTGNAYLFLVTAAADLEGEGTPGTESSGAERSLLAPCEPLIKHHILNRLGFGWSEWQSERIDTLGWQGYVDEQLAPETIDQSSNSLFNNREMHWSSLETFQELVYKRTDRNLYSWAQLERELTLFWQNHLTTNYVKSFEFLFGPLLGNAEKTHRNAVDLHLREEDSFRDLALTGTFREMLEASTLSAAMMIYLDNVVNIAERPNENYAREVMELFAMGVDCGYDEADIRELARVFTGWEVCKKSFADADDPLAPCTDPNFGLAGRWVSNFNVANHDHGQKMLFPGSAFEAIIPDTSADPDSGIDDVGLALDAIVAHPCTAEFISRKLLRHFITDNPTQEMVDSVVVDWNAHGGDLREVTRSVLRAEWLFDPDFVGSKLKTPQVHELAAYRALRGKTEASFASPLLYNWLAAMAHMPYFRVEPDGYPDDGGAWIGTNQLLSRQDMGLALTWDWFFYRTETTQMVSDYGLSTAEQIVDFFSDLFYGGALTPAERQRAITYLETDALGNPSPYDDNRIREAVGFMLGFSQFNER